MTTPQTPSEFMAANPALSPGAVELLLRLDGLTARLERAVVTLERSVGSDGGDDEHQLGVGA